MADPGAPGPVTTGQTALNSGFSAHIAAKNAAMAAKQTKDESRAALRGGPSRRAC